MNPGRTRILMILVAVLTAIAIWLVPVDRQEQPPSLPSLPSQPGKVEKLPLPAAEGSLEEPEEALEEAGITALLNGGDNARDFLAGQRADQGEPDVGRVFTEAQRRQEDGKLEDAYLLYRYAARHGHAEAAFILGTQADPAFHEAAGGYLPQADAAQAFKWYSLAQAAGNGEAGERLQELRERLQQDAADGDAQAGRLLLQWR